MAEPDKSSGAPTKQRQVRWTVILLVILALAFYIGFFLIMGLHKP
jgi:hypothetical protein